MATNEESGEGLELSPLPRFEGAQSKRVLSTELLASLVGVSTSSLRRYTAGARPTPDDVAARVHYSS